jgi:hypothetical protein
MEAPAASPVLQAPREYQMQAQCSLSAAIALPLPHAYSFCSFNHMLYSN